MSPSSLATSWRCWIGKMPVDLRHHVDEQIHVDQTTLPDHRPARLDDPRVLFDLHTREHRGLGSLHLERAALQEIDLVLPRPDEVRR